MLSWQAGIWVLLQNKHFGFQKGGGGWLLQALGHICYASPSLVFICECSTGLPERPKELDNYTDNRDFSLTWFKLKKCCREQEHHISPFLHVYLDQKRSFKRSGSTSYHKHARKIAF